MHDSRLVAQTDQRRREEEQSFEISVAPVRQIILHNGNIVGVRAGLGGVPGRQPHAPDFLVKIKPSSPTLSSIVACCRYVTDGINTLQGILIFLVLVVFRKRVVRGLADRTICGIRLPSGWRAAADDECEEIEEELNLSETQPQKL
jgi:hypothetical protein